MKKNQAPHHYHHNALNYMTERRKSGTKTDYRSLGINPVRGLQCL